MDNVYSCPYMYMSVNYQKIEIKNYKVFLLFTYDSYLPRI